MKQIAKISLIIVLLSSQAVLYKPQIAVAEGEPTGVSVDSENYTIHEQFLDMNHYYTSYRDLAVVRLTLDSDSPAYTDPDYVMMYQLGNTINIESYNSTIQSWTTSANQQIRYWKTLGDDGIPKTGDNEVTMESLGGTSKTRAQVESITGDGFDFLLWYDVIAASTTRTKSRIKSQGFILPETYSDEYTFPTPIPAGTDPVDFTFSSTYEEKTYIGYTLEILSGAYDMFATWVSDVIDDLTSIFVDNGSALVVIFTMFIMLKMFLRVVRGVTLGEKMGSGTWTTGGSSTSGPGATLQSHADELEQYMDTKGGDLQKDHSPKQAEENKTLSDWANEHLSQYK